ncbi:MAG: septum formation inhibitor Maf [Pseudomonadales bacterium]|nr:septum formation inhibitor Maf [Pseudomonadales bacterium]
MFERRLLLASQSPRRASLLQQMGLNFEVQPADIDETPRADEDAIHYVDRLAKTKAQSQWRPGFVHLGADTIVVLDGELLGKPRDEQHAMQMLMRLSGRSHQVATGVAVFDGQQVLSDVVVTTVTFRSIDNQDAQSYWATGEPADKAGAYALQGIGGVFVTTIAGSYSNVIGLPMAETEQLLASIGVNTWLQREHV